MNEQERPVLPLDARIDRQGEATVIRIPLRVEELRVGKETFVAERVGVRTTARREVERASETLAREELRVDASDALAETRRLDTTDPVAPESGSESGPPRWANRIDRT
jgi:stress response protein YsnF